MATSGSFGINGGGWNTTFGWSLNHQNIGGNYSVIDWWWDANWVGSTWVNCYGATISINGGVVHSRGSGRLYGGRAASGQATIWHNSDGSRSFSADGNAALYSAQTNAWGSGGWELPRIPRNALLLTAQDFNDEGNPTITYSNPAGNNLSVLRAGIFTTDGLTTLAAYRDINKTGTSYTFQLTEDERNAIRSYCANNNTAQVGFYLWSIIAGNDARPSLVKTVSIINANPIFNNFTYADINAGTTAITGNSQVLIQNKSKLKVTVPAANAAEAKKSAHIKAYAATINGQTQSLSYSDSSDTSVIFGAINANTNSLLSVAAIDSRGNTATVNKQVQFIPYTAPIVVASGTRKNNFDKETKIHIEGTVSLLQVGGVTKNVVNATSGVQYRYREQGTSAWGSWTNRPSTIGANGTIGSADFWLNLDNNKAYEFQVKITDKLETSTASFTVGVGIPIMRIGLDGHVYNKEQPLMPSHVGQVIFSTTLDTAEKVQAIYGGIWVAFAPGRVPVCYDGSQVEFNAPKKTGGTKTVTLDVNQIPPHNHPYYFKDVNSTNGYGYNLIWEYSGLQGPGIWANSPSSVGGGQAHSNLQPYITVYAWERAS